MSKGKDLRELLEISKIVKEESDGKYLLSTKDVLSVFGYSSNSNLTRTKAVCFVVPVVSNKGAYLWRVMDMALVKRDDLPTNAEVHFLHRNDKPISYCLVYKTDPCPVLHTSYPIHYENGEMLFLINRKELEFWKLKEYGGWL